MKVKYLVLLIVFIFLSDTASSQKVKLLKTINTDLPVGCIRLSPDKKLVGVSDDTTDPLGFQNLNEKFTVTIMNANGMNTKFKLEGHLESIVSLDFSYDSKFLVSSDKNGLVIIWDLDKGILLRKIETKGWVHGAKFTSSAQEIIVVQGHAMLAIIYNLKGDLLAKMNIGKTIVDFEINKLTNEILFACNNEIQIWSLISRQNIRNVPLPRIMCIRFNDNCTLLGIGFSSGDILVTSKNLSDSVKFSGHFKPVLSLSFNADNSSIATSSSDYTARIWSLKRQGQILQLTNEHKGFVNAVEFISKDKFVTGGENKELKVWKSP
jgi:WD40 repeat protein